MAETCGARHPNDSIRTCIVKGTDHGDHQDRQGVWDNEEHQVRVAVQRAQTGSKKKSKALLNELSGKVAAGRNEFLKKEREAQRAALGPIVRTDDPSTSHEAARRYQPKRDSMNGRVLAYLQQRINQWVDAPDLTDKEVGNFGGTRRLRELRERGWPIETRKKPGSTNTWQHRLLSE